MPNPEGIEPKVTTNIEVGGEIMRGPNQEKVEKHINEGLVPFQPGRECGDGRYGQNEAGKTGEFGVDSSLILTKMASDYETMSEEERANYDVEGETQKIVDAVIATTGEVFDGKFYYHTDDHAEHKGVICGCGHVVGADSDARYGMEPGWAGRMVKKLGEMKKQPEYADKMVEQMLTGSHNEAFVLVNQDTKNTIAHTVTIDGQESSGFVKDDARGAEYRKAVYATLGYSEEQIAKQEKIKGAHDTATSARLAQGKEVYLRDADGKVTWLGWMQEDGSQAMTKPEPKQSTVDAEHGDHH